MQPKLAVGRGADPNHMRTETQVLVTGSAGYIGSHTCETLAVESDRGMKLHGLDLLPARLDGYSHSQADIRSPEQLRQLAGDLRPDAVIHLAAKAQAVVPWEELPDIFTTNINGTINVLTTINPRRIIFASTCAVYGNTNLKGVRPTWGNVHPVGSYGITKASGELVCRDWAKRTGNLAVALRLGNVVGKRCRGLIPYLVAHARKYPDGSVPARLRGKGLIVRDYVPVSYVVQIIRASIEKALPPGKCTTFNVGTGRGTTNREVASIVQDVLKTHRYLLRLDFDNPIEDQEAQRVVMNPETTEREIGIPRPTPSDVVQAIQEAVVDYLEQPSSTVAACGRS